MFKQLFRLTVVTYVWKRYKALIVSTIVLFAFFWLVGQLHQDYLNYGDLNGDKQYIGVSFVIKWLAFVIGFILYLLFNSWQNKRAKRPKDLPTETASAAALKKDATAQIDHTNDPFYTIRQKDKLRSKADMIIEKK